MDEPGIAIHQPGQAFQAPGKIRVARFAAFLFRHARPPDRRVSYILASFAGLRNLALRARVAAAPALI